MDSFIEFGLIFCVTWVVVSLLLGMWDRKKADKAELQDRIYRKLDEIIHRVKVEEHYGHLYWFDQDNDRFLGQGATQDEVIAVVKKRFPEHIFFLSKDKVVAANTDWKLSAQSKFSIDTLNLD
jgi:hypothetical protein